jgi:nitric oxide reductase NorD protein
MVELEQFQKVLGNHDLQLDDTLAASFNEARRVMSTEGLTSYLTGAQKLTALGRGHQMTLAYLQSMPAVTVKVGESIIEDIMPKIMRLSSLVSAEVISLTFDTLPTVAKSLGSSSLVEDYLSMIHQIATKAPRGLRPMLSKIDQLFSKLTLGGLRRWALWGAQTHGRDLKALVKYFNLDSIDSQAVLKRERRGTLFVDQHRKLNFYLRALWGRGFYLRPTSGDFETRQGYQPYIEQGIIHLPDAFDDYIGVNDELISGGKLYRATCVHATAHLAFSEYFSVKKLTPPLQFFIALFEDARVEHLAIKKFPGLKALWLPFLRGKLFTNNNDKEYALALIPRLALALLDTSYIDPEPLIQDIVLTFWLRVNSCPNDSDISVELGIILLEHYQSKFTLPNRPALESTVAAYRDDNRILWTTTKPDILHAGIKRKQRRKKVNVMTMVNEIDCELAGGDAQEIWTLDSEFFRDGDPKNISLNQLENSNVEATVCHYPEWDYQGQIHRPDWVTLVEKQQPSGDPREIDQILNKHKTIANRIRYMIDAMQPQGVVRQRYQEEGDTIDIDAAINAMISLRIGQTPDSRINTRYIRKNRDVAVVVLLDLSESTNERTPGSNQSILELSKKATALLSWAIDGIGDPFAIHGFASDGRHDLQYYRFKDFSEPYDNKVKARLSGMQGGLSTRMGGALRHAAYHLQHQNQRKKLVLLITDGQPADIDVTDPMYLRHDTKKAIEELTSQGISSYCLTLDPNADDYISHIFGPNRFTVIDQVARLPDKLPVIFATLTC